MKGLTPQEFAALKHMALPHAPRPPTEEEHATLRDLEEQRRVVVDWNLNRWVLTPAGHEALKLWLRVRDALGAQ